MDHLVHDNLFNVNHHGLVRLKSCVTNLLECADIISLEINRGQRVDVINLDFSKAFEMYGTEAYFINLTYLALLVKYSTC